MTLTIRPLADWQGDTESGWEVSRFDTTWSKTQGQLEREVGQLQGENLVVQVDLDEADLRLDGDLRSRASVRSSRVRVLFDTPNGTLVFQAARYSKWQDNVRAVTLTLEALRGVERWGAIQGGSQYKGLLELEGGSSTSAQDAADILARYSGTGASMDLQDRGRLTAVYRVARRRTHPDSEHGSAESFRLVQAAAQTLGLGS